MAKNAPAQQLYDLLVSKDYDPQLLNAEGLPSNNPADTDVFSFDWSATSGNDYGTVVAMLGDDHNLTIFFGDNVGKSMEGDDKTEWFDFLYQMRMFAKRNLLSFSVQNLNKLKFSMQSMAAIKESIFESWTGNKTTSWNAKPTEARLMIKHSKMIGEGNARYRYVESLFIETVEGERFKLPFTKISAGKAMLEHIKQGGRPYDARGQHISTIVNEMSVLSRFRKSVTSEMIAESDTATLVAEAYTYQANLKRTLESLQSRRGYTKYFESWNPEMITEQDMVIEGIRTLFATESMTKRIESALPLLAKIHQQGTTMKETGIFEGWINCLAEGTWELPDTPEKQERLIKLLSKELPVGPDATNATEQLYDLLGDDELFDRLEELADQDASADARTIIINRLEQMSSNSAVAQVIGKLKIEQKPQEEPEEPVSEDTVCETCHQHTCECSIHEEIEEEFTNADLEKLIAHARGEHAKQRDQGKPDPFADIKKGDAEHEIHGDRDFVETVKDPRTQTEDPPNTKQPRVVPNNLDKVYEGTTGTIDDLSDDELDACIDGSTDLDLIRKIAHQNELENGMIEVEDFAFDFAEAINTNDSESYDANEDWGTSIANNINDALGYGSQLNELSKETMKSYLEKGIIKGMRDSRDGKGDISDKREAGLNKAMAKVYSKEDQLDELNKDTLGSYVKKASSDRVIRNFDQGYEAGTGKAFDWDSSGRDDKRRKGIIKAVDRLVKEDEVDDVQNEIDKIVRSGGRVGLNDPLSKKLKQLMAKRKAAKQINELSPDTLKNYYDKSQKDALKQFSNALTSGHRDAVRNLANRTRGMNKAAEKMANESAMSEVSALYDDWLNSEYAPYTSDAGDANEIQRKAASFLRGQVDRSKVDDYAEMMARHYDGDLNESTDTVEKDSEGKVKSWKHEGDWEKTKKRNGKEVDARGEVTNMVGKELEKAKSLKELDSSTLKSYVRKAADDKAVSLGNAASTNDPERKQEATRKFINRHKGINKAIDRLEEFEYTDLDKAEDMAADMLNIRDQDPTDYSLLTSQDIREIAEETGLSREAIVKHFGIGKVEESTGVTDFNPPSQGGTRKELLAKFAKTKDSKDAEAARKAGASQMELQAAHRGELDESTALTGQYGHSGKMSAVTGDHFGKTPEAQDKFAEDIARLKALALIK